jgi:hydroxymethylpyrimidine/phosphomethylpyrimidine kinase
VEKDFWKKEPLYELTENLFPKASLLTPNIPEAEVLGENAIKYYIDMEQTAKSFFYSIKFPS